MKYLAIVFLLALGACAPAESRSEGMSSRSVITRTEIEAADAANAFDLVQALRPEWLRNRGLRTVGEAAGAQTLIVYLDNARLGEPQTMRRVTLNSVQYLEYFTPSRATQRWGGGHLQGAILISTQER